MKFQFKIQLFQTEAAESVVKVFAGQPNYGTSKYRRDVEKRKAQVTYEEQDAEFEMGYRNIALLSKLVDQRMLFALQYEDTVRLAAYRVERVLISGNKPFNDWNLSLSGLNLGAVWENMIAQIGGIGLTDGKNLDETIIVNEYRDKLTKQIAALDKKAADERQPRRKWELADEIKKLKAELEELKNG